MEEHRNCAERMRRKGESAVSGGALQTSVQRKNFYEDWLWEGEKPFPGRGVTWAESGRMKSPEWQGRQLGIRRQ